MKVIKNEKRRKRATKPKINPRMITSAENYTNKKRKKKKRTDRTLGQIVKAKLYRQNHTEKHTHTHSQREKGEKKKSLIPESTASIWDDLLSIQVFHRCRVPQVDCGDLIRCS